MEEAKEPTDVFIKYEYEVKLENTLYPLIICYKGKSRVIEYPLVKFNSVEKLTKEDCYELMKGTMGIISISGDFKETIYKTYVIKCRKGYVGDFAKEYWTEADHKEHNDFVAQCRADGTLGEEFEIEMKVLHNPLFDEIKIPSKSSYKFDVIDFSNE